MEEEEEEGGSTGRRMRVSRQVDLASYLRVVLDARSNDGIDLKLALIDGGHGDAAITDVYMSDW